MKNTLLLATSISVLAFSTVPLQTAHANIAIVAQEANGGVIFSYTGSLRVSELSGPAYTTTPTGRVWPAIPWVEFAPASNAISNGVAHYSSVVASAPSNVGTGNSRSPTTFGGDYFSIDYFDVDVPNGYTDNTPISGTMTFGGATFTSMGLAPVSGAPYTWVLDNGETVTLLIDRGPSTVVAKDALEKKIKKLKSQLKNAKRRKKKGKAKKLKKALKAAKAALAAL